MSVQYYYRYSGSVQIVTIDGKRETTKLTIVISQIDVVLDL